MVGGVRDEDTEYVFPSIYFSPAHLEFCLTRDRKIGLVQSLLSSLETKW
jgi:hypothetical protein